jgi:hypothetical protein
VTRTMLLATAIWLCLKGNVMPKDVFAGTGTFLSAGLSTGSALRKHSVVTRCHLAEIRQTPEGQDQVLPDNE